MIVSMFIIFNIDTFSSKSNRIALTAHNGDGGERKGCKYVITVRIENEGLIPKSYISKGTAKSSA